MLWKGTKKLFNSSISYLLYVQTWFELLTHFSPSLRKVKCQPAYRSHFVGISDVICDHNIVFSACSGRIFVGIPEVICDHNIVVSACSGRILFWVISEVICEHNIVFSACSGRIFVGNFVGI